MELRTEAFFDFIGEREMIRLRKEAGQSHPVTDDPILRDYKFTNVRRFHDRTTTQLRENFYSPNRAADKATILMNCALARYFGTYEFFEAVGWQSYDEFDFDYIREIARLRLLQKERVFTGAYVITNQGISAPKQDVVVDIFLRGLHEAMPVLLQVLAMDNEWESLAKAVSPIPGFGGSGFMTKEVLLDTMMMDFWADTETFDDYKCTYPKDYFTWTPIGPGGRRGAARVLEFDYPEHNTISEAQAMKVILSLADAQGEHWDAANGFLYPTDIQFQLCEFDKYERVRLGQGRPRSRYHPRS